MINAENPRIKVFINFVKDLATLSKCTDRGVAAIIINSDATQIYSIGINGGPKGGLDCLCTLGGKYTCVHAEANALAKCTAQDPNKIMICSLSPCVTCASLIVNSGFAAVFYIDKYKDDEGLKILAKAGIRSFWIGENPYLPEGYKEQLSLFAKGGIIPGTEKVIQEPTEYVIPIPSSGDPLPPMPKTTCTELETFKETGSVSIALANEAACKTVREYANANRIQVRAAIDDHNQLMKIWRI